jgi:drug/metabolite transporter (DMT)-like permease
VTPRTTGILGMIGGAVFIVLCAIQITNPPFSILGALGVVTGSVLFAISATMTARRSWEKSHWPEMRVREIEYVDDEKVNGGLPTASQFAKNLLGGAVAWGGTGAVLVLLGHDTAWTNVWVGTILATGALVALAWFSRKAGPR